MTLSFIRHALNAIAFNSLSIENKDNNHVVVEELGPKVDVVFLGGCSTKENNDPPPNNFRNKPFVVGKERERERRSEGWLRPGCDR